MAADERLNVALPEEITAEYIQIRQRSLVEAKEFYFRNIMPRLRETFDASAEYQELRARKFETLVSLMGYSPETTVIAATILRPKRLVVAYSADEQARRAAVPALNYLTSEGIVDQFSIEHIAVNAFDPEDIYAKIRARIPTEGTLVFDITGGTKVMSATAGSLAWELNLTLCYLDGTWDPRSGSSGLRNATRLKLIDNPSRQKGHEIRRSALQFYEKGNYGAAQEAFHASRRLINDSFFDHLAWQLCICYQAMADFDLPRLRECAIALRKDLGIGGVRSVAAALGIEEHVEALERLSQGDRLTRIAAFLELADGYRSQGRHDFSCLLCYRAMESMVEFGLWRINRAFRMDAPEYALLGDVAQIQQSFSPTPGFGSQLPSKLTFINGFQLLCILDKINERLPTPLSVQKACMSMRGYAGLRNQSNLAHGYDTLTSEHSETIREGAQHLATAVLGADFAALTAARLALRPRSLGQLSRSSA